MTDLQCSLHCTAKRGNKTTVYIFFFCFLFFMWKKYIYIIKILLVSPTFFGSQTDKIRSKCKGAGKRLQQFWLKLFDNSIPTNQFLDWTRAIRSNKGKCATHSAFKVPSLYDLNVLLSDVIILLNVPLRSFHLIKGKEPLHQHLFWKRLMEQRTLLAIDLPKSNQWDLGFSAQY